MSCELVYPWGNFQAFSCGGETVTITRDSFAVSGGETLLDHLGYSREEDPEYLLTPSYGPLGATHYTGPGFATPYIYDWKFHLLLDADYFLLKRIVRRSKGHGLRFYDGYLALDVDTPRQRARVGGAVPEAPVVSGVEFFYPIFNVDVVWDEKSCIRTSGGWNVHMTGTEHDPDRPIPIGQDVAVVP